MKNLVYCLSVCLTFWGLCQNCFSVSQISKFSCVQIVNVLSVTNYSYVPFFTNFNLLDQAQIRFLLLVTTTIASLLFQGRVECGIFHITTTWLLQERTMFWIVPGVRSWNAIPGASLLECHSRSKLGDVSYANEASASRTCHWSLTMHAGQSEVQAGTATCWKLSWRLKISSSTQKHEVTREKGAGGPWDAAAFEMVAQRELESSLSQSFQVCLHLELHPSFVPVKGNCIGVSSGAGLCLVLQESICDQCL